MNINESLSEFQLITTNIIDVHISNNLPPKLTDLKLKRSFDLDYDISDISDIEVVNKKFARIILQFTIFTIDTDNDNKLLDFNVAIEGIFSAPIDIDENVFIKMLELNGLTALYGVARGHISVLSSAVTNSEKINLPMINIPKLVEKKHKETD